MGIAKTISDLMCPTHLFHGRRKGDPSHGHGMTLENDWARAERANLTGVNAKQENRSVDHGTYLSHQVTTKHGFAFPFDKGHALTGSSQISWYFFSGFAFPLSAGFEGEPNKNTLPLSATGVATCLYTIVFPVALVVPILSAPHPGFPPFPFVEPPPSGERFNGFHQ